MVPFIQQCETLGEVPFLYRPYPVVMSQHDTNATQNNETRKWAILMDIIVGVESIFSHKLSIN